MSKYFAEVFERDHNRCVFCGRDMMVDFETFWITVEDHLVPKVADGEDGAHNRVTACTVCNNMKGRFVPDIAYSKDNRQEYIDKIRQHIMEQRAKHMRDFASWTHPAGGSPKPPRKE